MRLLTTVMVMAARCRVNSVHVLSMNSAVTNAQLCWYCLCLRCQNLDCSNGRRSSIKQY